MESQPPNFKLKIWAYGFPPATGAASDQHLLVFRYNYYPQAADVPLFCESMIPRLQYLEDPQPFTRNVLSVMGVTPTLFGDMVSFISLYVQETLQDPTSYGLEAIFFCLELVLEEGEDIMERALRESAAEAARTVPAAASAIKSLKEMKVAESATSTEWCTICLEDLSEVVNLVMPCSHVFHKDCIVRWLESCHTCPLCRYAMPTSS